MQHLGDGSSQRGLAVVNVTDGADVYVRFRPLELRLCHFGSSWILVLTVEMTFISTGWFLGLWAVTRPELSRQFLSERWLGLGRTARTPWSS